MKKDTKRNTFQKVMSISARGLFVGVFLLVLLLVVQGIKNPGQAPSILGYQPLTVLSNSMNPSFDAGDLIIIRKTEASEINVDDVVTFSEKSGPLITHRVIEVVDDQKGVGLVTKGDNNNIPDEQIVRTEMLQGKKFFHIPNVGFVAKFASGPAGFVLLIVMPLIVYLILEVLGRMKRFKAE